jgi:hypothetical protein
MTMAATQRHIELEPAEATAANTKTDAVAAALAATAGSPDAIGSTPPAAEPATSIWLPATAIVGDMDRESAGVVAGLAAHNIKVARRNTEAVTATVGTDEENSKALTTVPAVSA